MILMKRNGIQVDYIALLTSYDYAAVTTFQSALRFFSSSPAAPFHCHSEESKNNKRSDDI